MITKEDCCPDHLRLLKNIRNQSESIINQMKNENNKLMQKYTGCYTPGCYIPQCWCDSWIESNGIQWNPMMGGLEK
jgi:hypothetical protein